MAKISTENHIRPILDPVHPSHLQSSFDQVVATQQEKGGMKAFQRLGGHAPITLDGTEYFCSYKLGCPLCQTSGRSNGKTEFDHSMLAARTVAACRNRSKPARTGAPETLLRTHPNDHRLSRLSRFRGSSMAI